MSTELIATTGITFGLSEGDSKNLDIIAFIILPAIIYALFFILGYIYFKKRKKNHLKKFKLISIVIFLLVLFNLIGSYYWY